MPRLDGSQRGEFHWGGTRGFVLAGKQAPRLPPTGCPRRKTRLRLGSIRSASSTHRGWGHDSHMNGIPLPPPPLLSS
jgi:hypothetical protein